MSLTKLVEVNQSLTLKRRINSLYLRWHTLINRNLNFSTQLKVDLDSGFAAQNSRRLF